MFKIRSTLFSADRIVTVTLLVEILVDFSFRAENSRHGVRPAEPVSRTCPCVSSHNSYKFRRLAWKKIRSILEALVNE